MTLVIGHRGAPRDRPENTLESYREALSQGADGVEIDIRLAGDGSLVVWHDPAIGVAGEEGLAIHELSLTELRPVDLTKAVGPESWETPTSIATLAEVFEATGNSMIDIELKNIPGEPFTDHDHRLAELVPRAVSAAGAESRVIITSFWASALEAVHESNHGIPLGWLLIPGVDPLSVADEAIAKGFNMVLPFDSSIDLDSDPDVFEEIRAAGLQTWIWTVNDLDRIAALASAGADAIITDRPGDAAGVLR